jgi:LysM repeat protein
MVKSARLLAILSVLVATTGVQAAQQPPSDLQQVGDHWSAWSPPSSFPEEATVHTVEPGETLWSIAQKVLGDPYLWPQIWEQNRWVEDSHWIYPGDPLVVSVSGTPIADVADMADPAASGSSSAGGDSAAAGEQSAGAGDQFRLDRRVGPPAALGSEDDIHCSGFIGADNIEFERYVIGSEFDNLSPRLTSGTRPVKGHWGTSDAVKFSLSTGDILYIDGGAAAGLTPGLQYTAVTPQEVVRHPVSGEVLGRFYKYTGRLRVLSVQENTAITEIVHGCDPVFVGAGLLPFEHHPVPLARRYPPRAVNDPQDGELLQEAPAIVRSVERIISMGQGHVVFIDQGANDSVVPGDIYTIYRLNDPGMPPVVIGELGVLRSDGETAVAKILKSRYVVYVGDRLDLETR